MKILIFRTNGNIVNINTYNMQELGLAKAFIKAGYECEVAYYGGKDKTHYEYLYNGEIKIKIWWLQGISIALNGIYPNLEKFIKQFDRVQVSDYDQLTSYYLYAISPQKHKTVLYHGPYLCDYNKKYAVKCKIIDKLPISKKVKETLPCFAKSTLAESFLRKRGFKNVTVVGVGLDFERLDQKTEMTDDTRSILSQIGNSKVILYIGRIEERRNTLFLLDVFNDIQRTNKNVMLVIVGTGDNEYKSKFLQKITNLKLGDRVIYREKMLQQQLPYLYKKATLFTMPTSYEIFGMVLLEAMYYGIPVITTPNGGSLTLNSDKTDIIITDLDKQKWVHIIYTLLTNEENNAKTVNKAKFSWDLIASIMLNHY